LKITRFVIALRPETIASADRALVVDKRVVQSIPPQLHGVGVVG
jgi:ABC-type multidrug transport system fused ATPase/permease subunit